MDNLDQRSLMKLIKEDWCIRTAINLCEIPSDVQKTKVFNIMLYMKYMKAEEIEWHLQGTCATREAHCL